MPAGLAQIPRMNVGFPHIRSLRLGLIRFTKCAEEPKFRVHLNGSRFRFRVGVVVGSAGCWIVFATLGEPVGDVFELRMCPEVLVDGYVVGVVRLAVPGSKADEVVGKLPSFTHGEVFVKYQEHKEVEWPAIEIVDHSSLGGSLGSPSVLDLIGVSSGGVVGVEANSFIWGKFELEAFGHQQFCIACDGIASR